MLINSNTIPSVVIFSEGNSLFPTFYFDKQPSELRSLNNKSSGAQCAPLLLLFGNPIISAPFFPYYYAFQRL